MYDTEKLRIVQQGMLKILEHTKQLCDKLDIKFFMHYGSLIGTLRHGGFVPWDDDVDIAMHRTDYDILLNHLKGDEYYNQCTEGKFTWNAQEVLKIFYEDTPLCIDIFPLDQYYESNLPMFDTKVTNKLLEARNYMTYKESRDNYWNTTLRIPSLSYEGRKGLTQDIIMQYNDPTEDGMLFSGLETNWHRVSRKLINYPDVYPLQEATFEGLKVYIPNKPEEVLKGYYADIWSFPADQTPKHGVLDHIDDDMLGRIEQLIRE